MDGLPIAQAELAPRRRRDRRDPVLTDCADLHPQRLQRVGPALAEQVLQLVEVPEPAADDFVQR